MQQAQMNASTVKPSNFSNELYALSTPSYAILQVITELSEDVDWHANERLKLSDASILSV